MTQDAARERGDWKPTPWILRILGCPPYWRSVYANWRIGGGWDGWEFAMQRTSPPTASNAEPDYGRWDSAAVKKREAKGLPAVLREWAGNYEEGSFDTEAGLMIEAANRIDALEVITLKALPILSDFVEAHYDTWMDEYPDEFKIATTVKFTLGELRALRNVSQNQEPPR